MTLVKGTGSQNGMAFAPVFILKNKFISNLENKSISKKDIDIEINKLNNAILDVKNDLQISLKKELTKNKDSKDIIEAFLEVINDNDFIDEIKNEIKSNLLNASAAIETIINKYQEIFAKLDDIYLKSRIEDIKNIFEKVKFNLLENKKNIFSLDSDYILVAKKIGVSEILQIDTNHLKGIILEDNSETSHSFILLKNLNLPFIWGVDNIKKLFHNNEKVYIDEDQIFINPDVEKIEMLNQKSLFLMNKEQKNYVTTFTKDHRRIKIKLNISNLNSIDKNIVKASDGIGLFRSEFIYLEADNWPSESEQIATYQNILKRFKNKSVNIRTMDIGGDKNLKYYKFHKELNPFLGVRGIRIYLENPEILATQLRALIKANNFNNLNIMFPMITAIDEIKNIRNIFDNVLNEVLLENPALKTNKIKIGMMIETPASAILSDKFAKYVDFFSIGTNDLIQYTLATDRLNKDMVYMYRPLNPAIFKLIKTILDNGAENKINVGICGEMANNKYAIPVLLGLGLKEFSVSPSFFKDVQNQIINLDYSQCKKMSKIILGIETHEEIKKIISDFLN